MVQGYFKDSWLLPCSLRSHRTANPRPKMGFAIFRLCPPATPQVGGALTLPSDTTENSVADRDAKNRNEQIIR